MSTTTHDSRKMQESATRSIAKAITWQLTGLVTMTLLAFFATGDITAAASIALSGAVSGFIFFIVHERIWARIPWGWRQAR
ncbi:DUF2061 domain-containing protein [Devosia sp.]|uniref:DUF2061 domain-containing protein n=1 Tax=Devosia sp. TaxID=1871048 RepID=UPI003A91DB2F